MNPSRSIVRALAAGAALASSAMAFAPAAHAQSAQDQWQFSAAIYGWLPTLSSKTSFPTGTGGSSIEVDGGDVLDSLKMTFQGTITARRGQWGMMADWVYVDLGNTKDATRDVTVGGSELPASATANLSLDLKTNVLTLAGTYALVQQPGHQSSFLFGTRMLSLDERLDYTFSGNLGSVQLPGNSGRLTASATNWDAIVGVAGRFKFGDGQRWFVPYYADVGTGESKLTYQLQTGIGYSFGWGDLVATWRYLDYDFKSDSNVQSLTANGPAIGAVFRW
jgi:hypothetical protein